MKLVMLCGNQSNQIALVEKILQAVNIDGVVLEARKPTKAKMNVSFIASKLADRILFFMLKNAWVGLLNYYKSFSLQNNIDSITVSKINSKETIDFIEKIQPDYILISGTSLIKKEILSIKGVKGFINLHTGLSPYIKGGPNCTNWCIATNQAYLIGNTMMWLDLGIDSGNIIATELTPLSGEENLLELHIKVMNHAHDMYVRTIKKLAQNESVNSIKQSEIAEGTLYYTKMWNFKIKLNFLIHYIKGSYKTSIKNRNTLITTNHIKHYPL